ncbi:MAG: DUF4129 domain-containing protein, partial [Acidobacteria bacterium]|nr:DUF4129 domain-containing protein [Acidobacteriota bacterium]
RLVVRRVARCTFALLLILLGAGSAAAMPLEEYKSRIHEALTAFDEFWQEAEVETGTGAEYIARAGAVLEKIRKLVPSDEIIEWEGGRVRVNNSWLGEDLRNYEQTPASDPRRAETLARISQRLTALEDRLNELDGQNKTIATSKEQEKARLEAILRRGEYGEKPPEKSLWERFKEWLNNLFPSRNPLQPGQTSWLSFIAMILIFGLAAGVLAYVIWKFLPFFRRKDASLKLEKRGARVVLGEHLAPDQTAADLLNEAEILARKGELRAAIRKGYIALLCELGDRKVLTLAQHKTNHDYLRAVREKRPLLNEMQKLTASFENHWYGFVPATPSDWTTFRSGYQQTLKTASLLSDK